MTIKEMRDKIIEKYGAESEEAVLFCQMCDEPKTESWPLYIRLLFEYLIEKRP